MHNKRGDCVSLCLQTANCLFKNRRFYTNMMFIASTNIASREYRFSLSYFTNDCNYCRSSANLSIPPRLPRQLPHAHISADLSGSDCIHSDYNVRCNQICKVKQFMYMPGQATRISRQSAYKVAKLLAPEDIPGTLFCEMLSTARKDCQ